MKASVLKIAVMAFAVTLASCTKNSSSPSSSSTSTTASFGATIATTGGGTAYTFSTSNASLGANFLTITETATGSSGYKMSIYVPTPVSAKTYTIATLGNGCYATVQNTSGQYWSSSSGTLTITSYSSSSVSGTFSFTASGSSAMTVSNGSFSNIGI